MQTPTGCTRKTVGVPSAERVSDLLDDAMPACDLRAAALASALASAA
jgi:hypothetical protein